MAWLTVAYSNEELCDKLAEYDILKGDIVEDAFRGTDRGEFIPGEFRDEAYLDRPFKAGDVHLSAPHMYANVLEALDLRPGQAFLNVGSGSGYLSCLAAHVLGDTGLSHGIEINADLAEFSRQNVERWFKSKQELRAVVPCARLEDRDYKINVDIVSGNCFNIDIEGAMKCCKYDKIYIGAGCPENRKEFFFSLLADNGILVAPINECSKMLKVTRFSGTVYSTETVACVTFAPLINVTAIASIPDFQAIQNNIFANYEAGAGAGAGSTHASSGLTIFSPPETILKREKSSLVRLPPVLWAPLTYRHRQFPREFKEAVYTVYLATTRFPTSTAEGLCARVPTVLWAEIFSFCNRDWFKKLKTDAELLTQELVAERQMRAEAMHRLHRSEQARNLAERERDLYKSVIMRLRRTSGSRILHGLTTAQQALVHGTLSDEEDDDGDDDDVDDDDDENDENDENDLDSQEESFLDEEFDDNFDEVDEEIDGEAYEYADSEEEAIEAEEEGTTGSIMISSSPLDDSVSSANPAVWTESTANHFSSHAQVNNSTGDQVLSAASLVAEVSQPLQKQGSQLPVLAHSTATSASILEKEATIASLFTAATLSQQSHKTTSSASRNSSSICPNTSGVWMIASSLDSDTSHEYSTAASSVISSQQHSFLSSLCNSNSASSTLQNHTSHIVAVPATSSASAAFDGADIGGGTSTRNKHAFASTESDSPLVLKSRRCVGNESATSSRMIARKKYTSRSDRLNDTDTDVDDDLDDDLNDNESLDLSTDADEDPGVVCQHRMSFNDQPEVPQIPAAMKTNNSESNKDSDI